MGTRELRRRIFPRTRRPGDAGRAAKAAPILNAKNPDLTAFLKRGGRLIQYHGWNDPQIAPGFSLRYYRSVAEQMGSVDAFYRLFMVPGMAHCSGGEGTSSFDMLSALERWVEQNQPPDRIAAARVNDGHVERTRP